MKIQILIGICFFIATSLRVQNRELLNHKKGPSYCRSPNYHYDEGPSKNKCTDGNDCQCDGARTCKGYFCSGKSR